VRLSLARKICLIGTSFIALSFSANSSELDEFYFSGLSKRIPGSQIKKVGSSGNYYQCASGATLIRAEKRKFHPRNPNTYTYSDTDANGINLYENSVTQTGEWFNGDWQLPNKTIKSFQVELLLGNSGKRYEGELVDRRARNHEFTNQQKRLITKRYLISPSNVPTSYKFKSSALTKQANTEITLTNSEGKTLRFTGGKLINHNGDIINLVADKESRAQVFCTEDPSVIHIRHVNLLLPYTGESWTTGEYFPTAVLITDLQVKTSKAPAKKKVDF